MQFSHPPEGLKLALASVYDMTVGLICYYHQGTFNSNLLLNPSAMPRGAAAWSFYSITSNLPLLNDTFQQETNKKPCKTDCI